MTKRARYEIAKVRPNLLEKSDPEGLVQLIGGFFTDETTVQRVRRVVQGPLQFQWTTDDPDSWLWLSLMWIGIHAPREGAPWWESYREAGLVE